MGYIKRDIQKPSTSFFLFGPRGVGKSTWLKQNFKHALMINLLEYDTYLKYLRNPSYLRDVTRVLKAGDWVIIDEIQKIPSLLDEVHNLIENKKLKFILSGSSARKIKRLGGNLLAGRAITRYLSGFSAKEIPKSSVQDLLEFGSLPLVVLQKKIRKDVLRAYVTTYLKEEIQEESLVRNIQPFSRFLEVAALFNGEQVNKSNIAREAEISRSNIETYFSILEDTLVGYFLPAFKLYAKVREQSHPKFYWFDTGVARAVANLLSNPPEKTWLGKALETFIFHEIRVHNHNSGKHNRIGFYRLQSGIEIDFVIELSRKTTSKKGQVTLLEVKNSPKWDWRWTKGMLSVKKDSKSIQVKNMFGIYRGKDILLKDKVTVLPVDVFLKKLHKGQIF